MKTSPYSRSLIIMNGAFDGHQRGGGQEGERKERVVVCVCKDASVKYVQGRVR